MSAAQYELVARVGKARGLEGKVTASAADDLPFCLYEGLKVHVVPPSLWGPRDITISSIEDGKGSSLVLGFEEVTTRDDAEEIAGRALLADADDLDLEGDDRWYLGCKVEDERYGALGEVTELIETAANDVLVVEGPYGEVLVPVIDEVILSLPEEGREEEEPIRTRVMDGIVEDAPDEHDSEDGATGGPGTGAGA